MGKFSNEKVYGVDNHKYHSVLGEKIRCIDNTNNGLYSLIISICTLENDIELLKSSFQKYIEIYREDDSSYSKEYVEDICEEIQKRLARKKSKLIKNKKQLKESKWD